MMLREMGKSCPYETLHYIENIAKPTDLCCHTKSTLRPALLRKTLLCIWNTRLSKSGVGVSFPRVFKYCSVLYGLEGTSLQDRSNLGTGDVIGAGGDGLVDLSPRFLLRPGRFDVRVDPLPFDFLVGDLR